MQDGEQSSFAVREASDEQPHSYFDDSVDSLAVRL